MVARAFLGCQVTLLCDKELQKAEGPGVILVPMRQKASGWLRVVGIVSLVICSRHDDSFRLPVQPRTWERKPFPSDAFLDPMVGESGLQDSEQAMIATAQQNPNDFVAQKRLGEFYVQRNRLLEGIPYLEKAQQLNPQDYNTGYDLSLAYLNSGDTAKVSAQLQQMITQHETAELDDLLAEAKEKTGDYMQPRVSTIAPPSWIRARRTSSISRLFCCNIRIMRAFLTMRSSSSRYGVQKYPQSAKLTVGLGVTLYTEGKYDDAVKTLCAAADLDPKDPRPFQFLGKVSTVSPSHIPEIRKRLEEFVHLYPNNGPAIYYYAMSLWERPEGQPAADLRVIEALLQKAVAADPDSLRGSFSARRPLSKSAEIPGCHRGVQEDD